MERQEVAAALSRLRVGMVTTRAADGTLHTRPMAHHGFDAAGGLWFFTRDDGSKVGELADHAQVAIGFADPRRRRYLAVAGMGQLLHDREQARRLWRWSEREWFPAGPDDPHLLLLRVEALTVEEWHPAPAPLARAVGWVSAKLRRRPASLGRHRRWGAPIPS